MFFFNLGIEGGLLGGGGDKGVIVKRVHSFISIKMYVNVHCRCIFSVNTGPNSRIEKKL